MSESGWHSRQGSAPVLTPPSAELVEARQKAAALYPPGSPARTGILSGQWDGGSIVGQFLPLASKV